MQFITGTNANQTIFITLDDHVEAGNPVRLMDACRILCALVSCLLTQPRFEDTCGAKLSFIPRFCTAKPCIGVTNFKWAVWRCIFVMKLIFTTKSKKHETIKQAYFKQSNHRHTQQAKNAVHTRR
jgi:hypothetical protein